MTLFFSLGAFIGLIQVIESIHLEKNGGKITPFASILSLLEFIWVLVCIIAIMAYVFPSWTALIPASFVSYIIVMTWHYRHIGKTIEDIEELKNICLPPSAMVINRYFGISYCSINTYALFIM